MSSQLQILAGTVIDDATVGTVSWSNPNNAKVSDNVYTTALGPGPFLTYSHYLKVTNFGFSIPVGAIISGILVEIEIKVAGGAGGKDSRIQIVKSDGTIGTTNKATNMALPTTEIYISYGGSSDLWDETWTPANINDIDFGSVFSATITKWATVSVDHVRITVYYTETKIITGVQSMTGIGTITL